MTRALRVGLGCSTAWPTTAPTGTCARWASALHLWPEPRRAITLGHGPRLLGAYLAVAQPRTDGLRNTGRWHGQSGVASTFEEPRSGGAGTTDFWLGMHGLDTVGLGRFMLRVGTADEGPCTA